LPLLADGEEHVEVPRLDDGQHPLLALADHDLEGLHALLADVDLREPQVHPDPALGGGLAGGAGDAGGPEVLDADDEAGVEDLQAGLDEALLLERVAHLDAGSLLLVALPEPGGGEDAGAADPVAPGGGAEQ